jgi:ribosomal protein L11 methyltransferase
METTLLLIPFEEASAASTGWSIARVLYPASDVMPLLNALSGGGVSYYPDVPEAGQPRGALLLDRYFPGWMDVVRGFVTDPASIEIVPHDTYDFSWRLPPDPMAIGTKLRVVSSSSEARGPDLIRLNPGLAFGDFRHPTTALCAHAIMEVLRPESSLLLRGAPQTPPLELPSLSARSARESSLLDVGCGSGILFLLASRLGVKNLAATEISPYARHVAQNNAALNDVAISVTNDLPDTRFEIVVANVWARAFPDLAGPICARLAEGGTAIISGFGPHEADSVSACFPELRLERRVQDTWCALVGTRA